MLGAAQRNSNTYSENTPILLSGVLADIIRWLGLGQKLQPQPVPVKR